MKQILLVDDDPHILDVIRFSVEKAGHTCLEAKDGKQAVEVFETYQAKIDLIVLDVGLPEMDGLDVCKTIRKTSEVPILFLSARDEEIDRILGLEIGGDDYVTKPFSPRELVARINVILKRVQSTSLDMTDDAVLSKGKLALDPSHRSVTFAGQELKLTAIEFNILNTLLARPRMAFTRDQLLTAAWPDNIHVSDRTIDSHIRNLRSKLSDVDCTSVVETVHGIGFRLGACGEQA